MTVPYTRLPRPTMWLVQGEGDIGSFYISKAPVTNEHYEVFAPEHARAETSPGDEHPVVNVSLADALAYCAWYAEASKKAFRLPTEAEWQLALEAKGGAYDDAQVWHAENSGGGAHAIESKKPNGFGLYDMLGNVREWTTDGSEGVIRSGSFRHPLEGMRERRDTGTEGADDLGFRIVRAL